MYGHGYTEDMKRFMMFLLAVLLCFCTLSCENNTSEEISDDTTEVSPVPPGTVEVEVDTEPMLKEAVMALNNLNSVDLPSGGITVASNGDTVYVPEGDSTFYNAALIKRNKMFEKKYNTTLLQFNDTVGDMADNAYKYMMSGVYYADIFSIPQKDLGKYITKGLLVKTISLTDTDFSKNYYDSQMMEQVSKGSDCYGVYGAFNRDISHYYCLYVNRDMLSSLGLEMPYDLVKEGKWTWDQLIAMLRSSATLDSIAGIASPELGTLTSAVYKSGGQSYVAAGYKKTPELNYNNAYTADVLTILRSAGGQKTIYNNAEAGVNARTEFMQGKALFYIGTVSEMKTITTMTPDWCILPLPKLNEAQSDYYTYVSEDHPVIAVFAGARCYDMAAALDGLNAASYGGYLSDAYYYELIDTSIRDSSALDMMDYICGIKGGKAVNDFSDVYTEVRPYTVNAVAKGIYNYELTPESIFTSVKDGFAQAVK